MLLVCNLVDEARPASTRDTRTRKCLAGVPLGGVPQWTDHGAIDEPPLLAMQLGLT